MVTETQKLSSEHLNANEGLSVLTSEQKAAIERHLSRVKPSFENWMFDGGLYDALKIVFHENESVTKAMWDSIQDHRCTKSFYDVPATLDQFDEFEKPEPENALWNVNLRAACAVVKEQMKLTPQQPHLLSREEDVEVICTNMKASAGLINIGKSKRDSVECIFQTGKAIKRMIEHGKPADMIQIPAQVFHRAQISGFIDESGNYDGDLLKKKDRFVWGLDGATVTVEGQYAKPIIEHISRSWFGYAGGKEPELLRANIARCKEAKNYWASIDYSKFDQTVPSWLIGWCFNTLKGCFQQQYHSELDWIAYNFVNTKVAIPGRGIKSKIKGIPSGSNFTQVIGSMANAVMALSYVASTCTAGEFQDKVRYVKEVVGVRKSSDISMFVMGDDNLLFTSEKLDLQDFAAYVHRVFGVKINAEKCASGSRYQDPEFLKREWRRFGEYQDPCRLAVNVIHPERRRSYEGYSPWHIIYGLYLTYNLSFPRNVSERYLAEQMDANGGIKALESIPRSDLPGVMRAFGDDAIRRMVLRAERLVYTQQR